MNTKKKKNYYTASAAAQITALAGRVIPLAKLTPKHVELLIQMFYDEEVRDQRSVSPVFALYGSACGDHDEPVWASIVVAFSTR